MILINPCATFFFLHQKIVKQKSKKSFKRHYMTIHGTWCSMMTKKKLYSSHKKLLEVVLVSVPIFTTFLYLTTEEKLFWLQKTTENVGKTNTSFSCLKQLTHFSENEPIKTKTSNGINWIESRKNSSALSSLLIHFPLKKFIAYFPPKDIIFTESKKGKIHEVLICFDITQSSGMIIEY